MAGPSQPVYMRPIFQDFIPGDKYLSEVTMSSGQDLEKQ